MQRSRLPDRVLPCCWFWLCDASLTDGHVVSLVGGSAPSRWAAWITLTDLSGTVKEQAAAFTEGVLDDGHFSGEAKATSRPLEQIRFT